MRTEEIRREMQEEMTQMQIHAWQETAEAYEAEMEEYSEEYIREMDRLMCECIKSQNRDGRRRKGKLKYIFIDYMRSSVEDGTGEYIIRLCDVNSYADSNKIEGVITAGYRREQQEKDTEHLTKEVMRRIIRAKKYEVKDLLREYIFETYIKPIPEAVQRASGRIEELESYINVKKDSELAVYYGEMNERYDWKRERYTGE